MADINADVIGHVDVGLPRNYLIMWLFLPFLCDFCMDFHTDSRGHGRSLWSMRHPPDVVRVGALNSLVRTVLVNDIPDSKVHGANMGPTWVLAAPDGPHVGPMNLAIRDSLSSYSWWLHDYFDVVSSRSVQTSVYWPVWRNSRSLSRKIKSVSMLLYQCEGR